MQVLLKNCHRVAGCCSSISTRFFSSSVISQQQKGREIHIPMPYGYVAGKEWGEIGGIPVIAMHGWQDNAATWDTLTPLLDPRLHVIALDMPGHGRSAHLPIGTNYVAMDGVGLIYRTSQYLGWEKFNLLGHSLGSILCYFYAATFPDSIDRYAGIDALKPMVTPAEKLSKINRESIMKTIDLELRKGQQPSYTNEEAVQMIVKGYRGSVTEDSARILMKRGLVGMPGGKIRFSRDPRLRQRPIDLGTSEENLLTYSRAITCAVLNIKAKNGLEYEPRDIYMAAVNELRKNAASVEFIEVEGTHHVHLNDPEVIAPILNKFFTSEPTKSSD